MYSEGEGREEYACPQSKGREGRIRLSTVIVRMGKAFRPRTESLVGALMEHSLMPANEMYVDRYFNFALAWRARK